MRTLTFVVSCKASELNQKVQDMWATQILADHTYETMKCNKQLQKTKESAAMAKYALAAALN